MLLFVNGRVVTVAQWVFFLLMWLPIFFAHVVAITPTVILAHTGTSNNLYIRLDNTQSDSGSTIPFFHTFLTGESLSCAKNLSYIVLICVHS